MLLVIAALLCLWCKWVVSALLGSLMGRDHGVAQIHITNMYLECIMRVKAGRYSLALDCDKLPVLTPYMLISLLWDKTLMHNWSLRTYPRKGLYTSVARDL